MRLSKFAILLPVLLCSISTAQAACRYYSSCLDQEPTCREGEWSFDQQFVYKIYHVDAVLKEIFICTDSNGNIYENIFSKNLTAKTKDQVEHYLSSTPRDITDVPPKTLNSLDEAALTSCNQLALDYTQQYSTCQF